MIANSRAYAHTNKDDISHGPLVQLS